MDSRLQKLAMEQMSRMGPEQLAQIQQQMGNLSPAAMERMRQRMSSLSESDISNIEKKMQNTDPTTLPAVSSTVQARQAHAYQMSLSLKNEGNQYFRGGNYMAAIERYERAKANLSLFLDSQSSELTMQCSLNMANSYLKLSTYMPCIKECTEVLKYAPKNVKALYRRGQAYMHLGKDAEALTDLKATLQLTQGDPAELALIQGKIDEIQARQPTPASPTEVEEIPVPAEPRPLEGWERSAEALKEMSDEDIRKMGQWTGMDVNPEMVRSAQAAMKDMDAETLSQMASLAEKLHKKEAPAPVQASGSEFEIDSRKMDIVADVFEKNPDLVKQQAEKLSAMSHDDLDRLAKLSGCGEGLKLTPEMVKRAADSMAQMPPDELKTLPKMAQRTQRQTSRPPPSTPPPVVSPEMMESVRAMMQQMSPEDVTSIQQMLNNGSGAPPSISSNPEMVQHTMHLLRTMDEDTLVQMIGSSGMCRDTEQVRSMVKQMKSMSPKQMEMLAKVAGFAQRSSQAAKKVKLWLRSRAALVVAIVVLVIAVVLRLYDIM